MPLPTARERGISVAEALQRKSLDSPDETRTFDQGELRTVTLGDFKVARAVMQPGWKWSEHVKPIAKTDSCQVKHTGYVVSGRLKVVMDDGSEEEFGPGEAYVIPPGHDGWVVGDEPFVGVDVSTQTVEEFAQEAGMVEKAKDKISGQ
jgi:quercetin dioxygenase-like cupin family protein